MCKQELRKEQVHLPFGVGATTKGFIDSNFLLCLSIPDTNIAVQEPAEVAAHSATLCTASSLLHESLLALQSQFTDKWQVTHFQEAHLHMSGNSSVCFCCHLHHCFSTARPWPGNGPWHHLYQVLILQNREFTRPQSDKGWEPLTYINL
jgi:hypothetical protein